MLITDDQGLAAVLATTRTVAVVGASPKPERPSYQVISFLLAEQYEVFPVNPGLAGQRIQGCEVYGALSDIPVAIDMVDVFRQSSFLAGVVREAISIGAKTLWTQLGVIDQTAAQVAVASGLDVILDRCPAIELPRLRSKGLFPDY